MSPSGSVNGHLPSLQDTAQVQNFDGTKRPHVHGRLATASRDARDAALSALCKCTHVTNVTEGFTR